MNFRFRKLPARYAHIVLPFLVSLLMSCLVSGIATLRSIGLSENFISIWMSGWGVSWIVAFPALLFVLPVARRIVSWVVDIR